MANDPVRLSMTDPEVLGWITHMLTGCPPDEWRQPLADVLGRANLRTIRRWAKGDLPVPESVWQRLSKEMAVHAAFALQAVLTLHQRRGVIGADDERIYEMVGRLLRGTQSGIDAYDENDWYGRDENGRLWRDLPRDERITEG